MDLLSEMLGGSRRALARVISLLENGGEGREEVLRGIYARAGKAHVVGVTGAPGVGKSSLAAALIGELRREGLKVGVVAVDPASPFSGGALLGDRIRMQEHALDEGVFIRSMSARGSLGGLARAAREVVRALDAFGMDVVLVETVGVGQSELDVMHVADTTVVVLAPGMGDVVQAMKAGVLEIADVFAINKADLGGAEQLARELEEVLSFDRASRGWRPPIIPVVALTGEGVAALAGAIKGHREYLKESGEGECLRRARLAREVVEIALEKLQALIRGKLAAKAELKALLEDVASQRVDPYTAAGQLLKEVCIN